MKSPSKWFIAVKKPSGCCIFPSWSDCQASLLDISSTEVEVAAFPTIQQAQTFIENVSPFSGGKCLDSSSSAASGNTPHSTTKKNHPVPNVVILSPGDGNGVPNAAKRPATDNFKEENDKKRKRESSQDGANQGQAKEAARHSTGGHHGGALHGSSMMVNHRPPTVGELIDSSLGSKAWATNPAFANLVNAASSIVSVSPPHGPSLAANYLMNMSASSPSAPTLGHSDKSGDSSDWSKEDDALLSHIMKRYRKISCNDWALVAKELGKGKSPEECQTRWARHLRPGLRKGQWTEKEDEFIIKAVTTASEQPFTRWSELALHMPGRHGKQIRERWINHLNPNINHAAFTREDDLKLWEAHEKYGKKWVEIATKFFNSTRAENQIKNRWYSAAFKKFITEEFGPDAYPGGK